MIPGVCKLSAIINISEAHENKLEVRSYKCSLEFQMSDPKLYKVRDGINFFPLRVSVGVKKLYNHNKNWTGVWKESSRRITYLDDQYLSKGSRTFASSSRRSVHAVSCAVFQVPEI